MDWCKTRRRFALAFTICFALSSCSLEYFSPQDTESTSPEFVFWDANFTRSEDNNESINMIVHQIEQYNDIGLTYAKDAQFVLYDNNQETAIEGSCDLLSANTDNDTYSFYGNVLLKNYDHDAEITAKNLRWQKKQEIFSSATDEDVSITIHTKNTNEESSNILQIKGKNFSANGFDFTYHFAGPVRGQILEN